MQVLFIDLQIYRFCSEAFMLYSSNYLLLLVLCACAVCTCMHVCTCVYVQVYVQCVCMLIIDFHQSPR